MKNLSLTKKIQNHIILKEFMADLIDISLFYLILLKIKINKYFNMYQCLLLNRDPFVVEISCQFGICY